MALLAFFLPTISFALPMANPVAIASPAPEPSPQGLIGLFGKIAAKVGPKAAKQAPKVAKEEAKKHQKAQGSGACAQATKDSNRAARSPMAIGKAGGLLVMITNMQKAKNCDLANPYG